MRKMSKKERYARLRDWVLFSTGNAPSNIEPEFKDLRLCDVLPFPIKSGIFEKLTAKQLELAGTPITAPPADALQLDIWDRIAIDAIETHRRYTSRWWRRFYLYWGNWRWPRRYDTYVINEFGKYFDG